MKSQSGYYIGRLGPERYSRYDEDFKALRPEADEDLLRRMLFVLLSVNMSWEHNVSLYNGLKDLSWLDHPWQVEQVFKDDRSGLDRVRSMQVVGLGAMFTACPDWFWKTSHESAERYRERLIGAIPGLGMAKASFFIELTHPWLPCVCLDRHMLRHVFGRQTVERPSDTVYRRLERAWCAAAEDYDYKPGIARMACWDQLLSHDSHHFWSDCLKMEDNNNVREENR